MIFFKLDIKNPIFFSGQPQKHPAHNPRFNHDLQLEIDCIEWALKKIEVNKLPIDRLEAVTRVMIKDLEKRKDKAMKRSDADDFWIKIESLQWVLFVIFAIGKFLANTIYCYDLGQYYGGIEDVPRISPLGFSNVEYSYIMNR